LKHMGYGFIDDTTTATTPLIFGGRGNGLGR
jgi:hypothetical protein